MVVQRRVGVLNPAGSDFKVFVSRRDPMKLMDLKGTFPQT